MNDYLSCFNDERTDPVSGHSHPGNGYRAYDAVLMRFICLDNSSPFGTGGINPYTYCLGDPINNADPSGHFSIGGGIGIVAGILGILLTPVTGGTSLAATLSVGAVLTGVTSVALSIASEAVTDSRTASILGWTGMALGILSGVGAGVVSKLAPESLSISGKLSAILSGHAHPIITSVTEFEETPAVVSRMASVDLGELMNASYPIEQRIMNYLDTAAVHNLRQTSKIFGSSANRAMAFRMNTEETGIPEVTVGFGDFVRRWSHLPQDTLENILAADRVSDVEAINPRFLGWCERNILGVGRSRPIAPGDAASGFVLGRIRFSAENVFSRYGVSSADAFGYDGTEFQKTMREFYLSVSPARRRWLNLNHGFWVGF